MRRLLVPVLSLMAAACATGSDRELQEVRRFHPGSEQLATVYSRWVEPDGSFVKDGDARAWFEDGTPRLEARYVMDQPDGSWKEWFANGQVERSGVYILGKKHGEWVEYEADGTLLQRWHWDNGRTEGGVDLFDSDGHPILTGQFAFNRREGEWTIYYPNGQMRLRGRFERGAPKGRWTAWYSDGARLGEGFYKDGMRDGLCIRYDASGDVAAKCRFAADVPVGNSAEALKALPEKGPTGSDPFDFAGFVSEMFAQP